VLKRNFVYDLEPSVRYSQIEYTVHLDRKPLYYVVNIILPCSLLIVVSLLVRELTSRRPVSEPPTSIGVDP